MAEETPKLQELLKKKGEEITKQQDEMDEMEKESSSHGKGCSQS